MSWFDTAGIANFAKSALTTAQKTIDKALDIQEETNSQEEKKSSSKKIEAENFFEAFGLIDKPSTSQSIFKTSTSNKAKSEKDAPSVISKQSDAHGSGFWSDTWGSLFENKDPEESNREAKTIASKKEETILESSKIKDGTVLSQPQKGTVLSQPQKASLFPSESSALNESELGGDKASAHLSASAELPKTEINSSQLSFENNSVPQFSSENDNLKSVSFEEHLIQSDSVSCENSSHDKKQFDCKELNAAVVTEQPCNEPLTVTELNETPILPSPISNANAEKVASSVDCEEENLNSVCDKSENSGSSVSITPDAGDVPLVKHLLASNEANKALEESAFFTINLPVSPQHKGDSDKNVLDFSISTVTNDQTLESEKESKPTPEIVTDALYDVSSSTLIIPDDLPVTMPENIANWECCALDAVSPDLFVPDENESTDSRENDRKTGSNSTLELLDSENSFHTISADSYRNNQTWISSKSHHFIDESQNSSNGERNSHHTDESSNSSKDDEDTDTAEVKECDAKSTSSNGSHTTSSSFVKCSVDDTNSTRGQSPTSTIASEKSDVTKQESEQTTSGDENETATSSDIEILSPPNGEANDRNSSPMKHIWLPRPLRLRRSESPTSDSSKDSMMPVVNELDEVCYVNEANSSLIYDGKREALSGNKEYEERDNIGELLQKQDELQNLLGVREKKLVELSKENIELQENEQRLKNLIQKMRSEQAKESRDVTALTREFSQRLSLLETQLKETVQERDVLKNQYEEAKKEFSSRISASDVEEVIKEKDQQIKELTEEGQKLSKKELLHTTIIRKLRAKEEEMNKTIKSQKEELTDNIKEVERLRKSMGAKEEQEKKHIDAIRELTNSAKKLEKEVSGLRSDLEDSREKELSLKKSLDSTYKDLTELRKSYASKELEVKELKSNLELQANKNLEQTLENFKRDASKEKDSLLLQMQELRNSLSRAEEEANSRERMFKAEIASLQKRLQEAEERNEDLTKNMSSATRPLVRQIENLQATFTTQTISWEKIEKNLTDRLGDAQNQVALLSEKERSATEKYLECQSKLTALETQNSSLRQDKMQMTTELESLRTNVAMLEENKSRENYTLDKVKQNLNTEIKKLKQEKANLENTMATCLEQLDMEKRKVAKLEEEIKIKDTRAMILSNVSPCPSPTGSVRSSVSSIHNWSQDENHELGLHSHVNSYRMSVYESLRLGSGSSLLENLQSQLKQREGEIYQLQSEISKLEQVKEMMTRELVQLTEQNEELDKKIIKLESLEKEHKDLDQKYNTLLQMYGEKVEETEELQLDLADVKSMYKAQIEELLMKK